MHAREVFISYAGGDRDVAAALAQSLEAANVGVWWDAHLVPDEPFEQQVQRVLAEAKLIVAVLSPHALVSEWVRWELSQASQNGLHVVPLLVNDLRPDQLPPPLHLLPALALPADGVAASAQIVAIQIAERVKAATRSPARQKENDASRRLASAAARTARQAADIKHRKTRQAPPRPILVSGQERGPPHESATRYAMSDGLVAFLHDQHISVAFTSFLTDELYLIGRTPTGQLSVDVQAFRKPTGLFMGGGTLIMGTLAHIYRLENILQAGQSMDGAYSHCYLPRVGHFTGVLDTHDVGLSASGEPLFIATRFNCLAATSWVHSFAPVWQPFFISLVVAEDRCHLNGLAMRGGAPAYATAIAAADAYDGWRDRLADGGVVMDLSTNTIVCDGLSMPHSPRVHQQRLWLLNSGRGELGYIDNVGTSRGRYRPFAFCPGFVRGLAFHGHYALVGLSRPRYDDFAGLDLHHRLRDPRQDAWCGIQVIDTTSGECVHWFRIDGSVREIYDLAVLPNVSCPRSVSCLNDDALDLITIDRPRGERRGSMSGGPAMPSRE